MEVVTQHCSNADLQRYWTLSATPEVLDLCPSLVGRAAFVYYCPRGKNAWLVVHLLALTVNFVSQVGCESSAHSHDVCSVRGEVKDRALDDKRDLPCRLSLTSQALNIKEHHSAGSMNASICLMLHIFLCSGCNLEAWKGKAVHSAFWQGSQRGQQQHRADAFTVKLCASVAYDLFENSECLSGAAFSELLQSALFQMNFSYLFLLERSVVWTKCLDACLFSDALGFLLLCTSPYSAPATGFLFGLRQLIWGKGCWL